MYLSIVEGAAIGWRSTTLRRAGCSASPGRRPGRRTTMSRLSWTTQPCTACCPPFRKTRRCPRPTLPRPFPPVACDTRRSLYKNMLSVEQKFIQLRDEIGNFVEGIKSACDAVALVGGCGQRVYSNNMAATVWLALVVVVQTCAAWWRTCRTWSSRAVVQTTRRWASPSASSAPACCRSRTPSAHRWHASLWPWPWPWPRRA